MTQPQQAKDYAAACGLTLSAVFVPFSQSRNKSDKHPSLNWRVTLTAANGRKLETDYMQGCAHLPHYSHAFARNAGYSDAVARACETGKSTLRANQRNAFDACQSDRAFSATRDVPPPELCDVLYCLVSDAYVLDYARFEDWASDFGYETDSRSAERIYRACLETALTLRQLIDIDAARTAFQDY